MKKNLLFAALTVFMFQFALTAQEPPAPGMEGNIPPQGEENNNGQNMEKPQSADELFPYTTHLRTHIDKNDYLLSLKRAEEIYKRVKNAFLPDAQAREKYVKLPPNAQIGTSVQEFNEKEIREDVESRISKEVLGGKSVNPVGQPLHATRLKARDAVQDKVKIKFPFSDKEMIARFTKEAEKKYPLAKKGDKVTVHYTAGRTTYRISGTFYGYGIRNRSILVNSRTITVRDLSKFDIPKFSLPDNNRAKQTYVQTAMKKYRENKFKYEKELSEALLRKEIAENDKNGFIYYGVFKPSKMPAKLQEKYKVGQLQAEERLKYCFNEWVSADKVITDMASDMISITKKRIAHERKLEEIRLAEIRRKEQEEAERKRQEQQNNQGNENNNPDAGNPPADGGAPM